MLRRALFAVAVLAAVPAAAQELQPLADWTKGADAKTKQDYLFTRCAALYLSIIKFDGMAYAQPELELMKKTAVAFATAAAKVGAGRDGGKPEDYINPVVTQAEAMSEQYSVRIVAAREKGKAIDNDSLLGQDDAVCREIAGTPKKGKS